ncbi:MAG TPA: TonB-dependent receptor [Thermoanaerobaculia bacterium]|nr:TonB-dependent receptor [Thermoanaerobaculia bacterium]
MKSRALVLSLGLALLLTALPMLAQIPTGTISGKVTSAEGEALPGVTVTVSSENLQGTRNAVTSETGEYNIPLLPPGEYEISFELEGFSNPKRSVKISAAQATRLDADLTSASVSEEIVVTGSYETISTAPEASTTYEKEFIESLPIERNIRETVLLTPGVSATGPGGNARNRAISIAGSQSYESLFLVNGVVVNENLRGQAFPLFIEDAIEETTTTVSGISAEYGRFSGGVVNTITKSGGNEMHGSLRTAFTNQSWEEKTPVTVSQRDQVNERYEATLGGWLWKDKIWYFLAGRDFEDITSAQTFVLPSAVGSTAINFPAGTDQQRYEGKLTLSPFQGHRFVGSYIKIDEEEIGNRFGNVLDEASLVVRTLPQELSAINYTGVLTENFFVEAQYSQRDFTFENSGSRFTDLINGTLMVDGTTAFRWWSPTFCGVCTPEGRSNENLLAKASWFVSSDSLGSHDLAFGYDTFDDQRLANNHQSGSDFRIITRSAIQRNGVVYPVLFSDPNGTLNQFIQFNPILKSAESTHFNTNSIFVNDKWRLNDHWSFNLGVRYDENDGEDAEGKKVADDSKITPRLSLAYDPRANGNWVFSLNYAEYVAAIANSQANSTSAAGNPATFQWAYGGPSINTDPNGPLLTTDQAIQQIFNWFNTTGGINNTNAVGKGGYLIGVDIPGGTTVIRGSLSSPFVQEVSFGAAKRLGSRGIVRADVVHRDYKDFYSTRTDLSTGQVITATGTRADLGILENSNDGIERVYDGLHTQAQFRINDRLSFGAVYTLSHLRGTFDGETTANGPVSAAFHTYPEYKRAEWNSPRGDLALDQRHRGTLWAVYDIFRTSHHSLNASLLQSYASGLPYGAFNRVNSRNFVTNPGYAIPPSAANIVYYYTNRDAFRTDDITATDLALNYAFQWAVLGKDVEIFLQPEVLNVFNEHGLLNVNTSVQDATNLSACPATNPNCRPGDPGTNPARLFPFNPFTDTPVEGINWRKGANFGKGVNENDFQTPRTYRFSVGIRF